MGMPIGNLRVSMAIIYNDNLFLVTDCEHAKLGRGAAFCRVKIKNLRTSQTMDATLRDSDNIEEAFIDKRKLQYLYKAGEIYHFMDLETYEDLTLDESHILEEKGFLKDNLEVIGFFYNREFLNLELPNSIEFKIVETSQGFRGDTVKAGTKPATLENGIVVQVPLFISPGEVIKVDTRTRKYIGRA
jgi:elongation factor P